VTLIIVAAVLTLASVVISYWLSDHSLGRKIVALVGFAGVMLYLVQGYLNLQRVSPRTLNSAQQQRIASQMQQFFGVQYDVSLPEGDPEALIEKSLDDAGWKEVVCAFGTLVINRDNKPPVCVRPPGMKDVTVAFAPERASRLEHIASALASALTAEGISASFGSGNVSYQTDAIHILIGRKT
jgi:hypothetical protein